MVGAARGATPAAAGLRVEGVAVSLGRRQILRGVDFSVAPGEWLTVVGANGTGKSTLLRAMMGLIAHEGSVRIGTTAVSELNARQRAQHLALVAQTPVLPPAMTVSSYVLLGRLAHMGALARESAADLAAVHEVLARLDGLDLADRRLGTLSGGEAQRVTIARALVQRAPFLLLDEPTSSLDIGHQLEVLDLVDELRRERGLTVVSTMHDLTLAAQYADRLALLADGGLAAIGSADTVLTEANLSRYYQASVRVVRDGETLVIVPSRRAGRAPTAAAERPEGAAW